MKMRVLTCQSSVVGLCDGGEEHLCIIITGNFLMN
jgi:hypothetical protein